MRKKKSVTSNTGHFFCFNSTVPMLIACNMFLSLLYNFKTYKNDQGTYRNWIIGKQWRIIKYVKSNWDFVTIISYLQKGLDLIQPNLIKNQTSHFEPFKWYVAAWEILEKPLITGHMHHRCTEMGDWKNMKMLLNYFPCYEEGNNHIYHIIIYTCTWKVFSKNSSN